MNWFVLLVIFEISRDSWAAPIELSNNANDITLALPGDELLNAAFHKVAENSEDFKLQHQRDFEENANDNKELIHHKIEFPIAIENSTHSSTEGHIYSNNSYNIESIEHSLNHQVADLSTNNKTVDRATTDKIVADYRNGETDKDSTKQSWNLKEETPKQQTTSNTLVHFNKNINKTDAFDHSKYLEISQPTSTLKQTADSYTEDLVEIGNQMGMLSKTPVEEEFPTTAENFTPVTQIVLETTTSTVENLSENLLNQISGLSANIGDRFQKEPEESHHSIYQQELKIAKNYETVFKDLTSVTQKYETDEGSTKSINHSGGFGQQFNNNITEGKLTKEEKANTPYDGTESTTVSPTATDYKSKITSTQATISKEAVYSFTEEAQEIGNKLHLFPESTTDEQVPSKTESYNEISDQDTYAPVDDINTTLIPNIQQPLNEIVGHLGLIKNGVNSEEISTKTQENITNPASSSKISKSNDDNNAIETADSDRSSVSTPYVHLVESASVKTEKNLTELLPATENKVAKVPNESFANVINREWQSPLGSLNSSLQVSNNETRTESFFESITTDMTDVQENTEDSTKMETSLHVIPPNYENVFRENVENKQKHFLEIKNFKANLTKQNLEDDGSQHEILSVPEVITFETTIDTASTSEKPEFPTYIRTAKSLPSELLGSQDTVDKNILAEHTTAESNEKNSNSTLENEIAETENNISSTHVPTEETTTNEKDATGETTKLEHKYSTSTEIKKEMSHSIPHLAIYPEHTEEFTTLLTKEMLQEFVIEPETTTTAVEDTTQQHFQELHDHSQNLNAFEEKNTQLDKVFTLAQEYEERTTSIKPDDEVRNTSEVPHRIDAVQENFVDKYADYYEENLEDSTSEMTSPKQLSELQESASNSIQTTEVPKDSVITQSHLKEFKTANEDYGDSAQYNNGDGIITVTTANTISIHERNATPAEPTIAEYTSTSTIVEEQLRKKEKNVEPKISNGTIAGVSTPNPVTTTPMDNAIATATTENSPQIMVTFLTQADNTTTTPSRHEEETDSLATTQIHETRTQTALVPDQQQQIESTTNENDAQTQSVTASGQTATTTNYGAPAEQEIGETEEEIKSTTIVAETTTTVSTEEPEARLLFLPPPKLEYSQSEDGVEVFYGYSTVKHN